VVPDYRDFQKVREGVGKSSAIDAFTRKGIPLGAHKAYDVMHDPVIGIVHAVRQLGPRDTFRKWLPHMIHDATTEMSLPLPFTFKLSTESKIFRLYAARVVNLRTAVIAPLSP
jgi:hypothetical protein